jgi:glucose-6-phosphate isomerase
MLHITNKQAGALFCKASAGTIDLIRIPDKVGTRVAVGDRVTRPVHETGFGRLVDHTEKKMDVGRIQ